MAISVNYKEVKKKYNPKYFQTEDEFITYYLLNLMERGNYVYYTGPDGVEKTLGKIDHFPTLKKYEVWMEGYAATGESATANLIGEVYAHNFAQACHIIMCKQKLEWIEKENDPNNTGWCEPYRWDYDPHSLRFWNCGLYWSEELARKSFG